jgi:hypothetical protein
MKWPVLPANAKRNVACPIRHRQLSTILALRIITKMGHHLVISTCVLSLDVGSIAAGDIFQSFFDFCPCPRMLKTRYRFVPLVIYE